jgi:hypothetical protein
MAESSAVHVKETTAKLGLLVPLKPQKRVRSTTRPQRPSIKSHHPRISDTESQLQPQKCAQSTTRTRRPFTKSLRLKLFGLEFQLQAHTQQRESQLQSPLFSLPLELRNQIYTDVFTSSIISIKERTDEPLSDWDNLLLTCHQAKFEMESIPAKPIIDAVQAQWESYVLNAPLRIKTTYDDTTLTELEIGIPRALFQPKLEKASYTYIPIFISPLFRLFSTTLIIKVGDDGTPLVYLRDLLCDIFQPVFATVWARDRSNRIKKWILSYIVYQDWPTVSHRNFFNTQKLVLDWSGSVKAEKRFELGVVDYLILCFLHPLWHILQRVGYLETADLCWDEEEKRYPVLNLVFESVHRFRKQFVWWGDEQRVSVKNIRWKTMERFQNYVVWDKENRLAAQSIGGKWRKRFEK